MHQEYVENLEGNTYGIEAEALYQSPQGCPKRTSIKNLKLTLTRVTGFISQSFFCSHIKLYSKLPTDD